MIDNAAYFYVAMHMRKRSGGPFLSSLEQSKVKVQVDVIETEFLFI